MCELLRSVRPEYSDLYASEFEDKGLSYVEDIVHVDWKDLKNQIPKLKYFHFVFIKKKAKEIVEKEASHNNAIMLKPTLRTALRVCDR